MSKVAIAGNASGTGVFTIASPNSNTDRTLTLPDSAGALLNDASSLAAANLTGTIAKARLPAGSVLQVVQTVFTTQTSLTSATYTDISGFAASITPSSTSSKILVMVHANVAHNSQTGGTLQIKRSGSAIPQTHGFWFYAGNANTDYSGMAGTIVYLDSPATTSSTTYQVAWRGDQSIQTIWINRSNNYPSGNQSGFSTITLMEIAG